MNRKSTGKKKGARGVIRPTHYKSPPKGNSVQKKIAELEHFNQDGMWTNSTLIRGFVTEKSLKEACKDAERLYSIKSMTEPHPPFNQKASILKRAIYQIGWIALEFGQTELLKEVAEKLNSPENRKTPDARRIPRNAPLHEENPFYYAFYIAFGNEPQITRHERSKASRQLVYAYRHKVPPHFLIGFIYQTGGSKVIDARLTGENADVRPQLSENLEPWRAWSQNKTNYWPIQ
ncbi:MAG: hypothetical protein WBG95_08980 [Sulfitobacter sp.]